MHDWSPQRVVDRLQIQKILYLYCRAIDRIQSETLAGLFVPDAIIDKGDGRIDFAAFVENVATRHPGVPRASHMITNCLIDFIDTDTAFVESWCLAFEQHPISEQTIDRVYRVRYGDLFKRHHGAWRIAERTFVTDHVMSVAVDPALVPDGGDRYAGRRNAEDRITTIRAAALIPLSVTLDEV